MSDFVGRLPTPPTANDVMVWDGTEFRPSKSVAINPILGAISAAALAIAFGTGIADANRIGLLPSTSVPGSESLTLYVGGNAGPTWTARGGVVDKTFADGGNVILGTVTGTQFGTSTSQKLGFYGAPPIIQPTGTTDLRTALINLGLYATGGASPLNLNGGALTAQTGTFASLTSGGVAIISTAGLLAYSAGLTYSSNVLTVGDGTGTPGVVIDGATSANRNLTFKTAGSTRWQVRANSTAEGGANAGTSFQIVALDDTGVQIDVPVTITRAAAGAVLLVRPLSAQNGTASLPGITNTTDTTTGWFRAASNAWGWSSATIERVRLQTSGSVVVNRNATTLASLSTIAIASDCFTGHSADSSDLTQSFNAYAGNINIICRPAGGTGATPTATIAGQTVTLSFRGFGTAFTGGDRAALVLSSTELWSATAQGTSAAIKVTKDTTVTTATAVTFAQASGAANPTAVFAGQVTVNGLAINDATDIALGTTTGTKLGTGTTQKLGFWNATPIAQKTGYGTPTGNVQTINFPGATATLLQTAQELAQLLLDLKAAGLIGA